VKTVGRAAPTRLAARGGRGEDGSFLASRGRGRGERSRDTVAPVTEDAIRESLSQRVADTLLGARESWTRRMFELANSMRADGGGPVYDLSLGNPSLEPPARWKEAVRAQLADSAPGRHRYMTNAGFPEVRAFIAGREAERYAIPLEAEDVTMTVGAAGGLNVLFRAVLDPGDEVLVPAPYFSEYDHYAANVGAVLRPVPTTTDFELNVDELIGAVTERTRILLLNSPNNPTGAVYGEASLRALADGLRGLRDRGRRVLVVEDTPYRDVVHDGSHVSSMLEHYEDTVMITSHSKDLGLAGERIGYLVISPRAHARVPLRRATSFCNRVLGFVNAPALMQRALPHVLGHPGGSVDVSIYADNCKRMANAVRELGFSLRDPKAGFFLFPGLPEALRTDDGGDVALTEGLREARCVVVPGTAFGRPNFLRLSMCVSPETVDGAIAAFQRVCA